MGKLAKGITIELDRPRRLVLDLNAMCEWETATGKNLAQIGKTASVTEIRRLLWVMLKADDPAITLEQAGALVDLDNMGEVSEALRGAVKVAMPEAKAKAMGVGEATGSGESPLAPAAPPTG